MRFGHDLLWFSIKILLFSSNFFYLGANFFDIWPFLIFLRKVSWFAARLVIPVWQDFLGGAEKQKNTGLLRIFFRFFFRGICSQERGFGGILGIPVFSHFYRIFLQEFLRDRNSCISTGFLRISPDSSWFLQDSCSHQNCLALASRHILPQLALPVASPLWILTDKRSQSLRALHETCFIQCNIMSYYN